MELLNKFTNKLVITHIGVLLVISILLCSQTVLAETKTAVVIDEKFEENAASWRIRSFDMSFESSSQSTHYEPNTRIGASVVDGTFYFSDTNLNPHIFTYGTEAVINCTTMYGEWNFEYNPGSDYSDFAVIFAHTFIDDISGKSESEIAMTGYGLLISSSDANSPSRGPKLQLLKYNGQPGGFEWVKEYTFPKTVTDWTKVQIIRSLDNETTVYVNSTKRLTYTDNEGPSTAENFGIMSWEGNTYFDNIQVIKYENGSITTDTTNGSLEALAIMTGIAIIGIISRFAWQHGLKKKHMNLY